MSQRRLTVGSLLGVPQLGTSSTSRFNGATEDRGSVGAHLHAIANAAQRVVWVEGKFRAPPPSKLGRGCCRSGCAGCPWAEMQRRGGQNAALRNADRERDTKAR